jgi:hypothetical protein
MHGTTTGEGLFLILCETMNEIELSLTQQKEVKSDGFQGMIGMKTI